MEEYRVVLIQPKFLKEVRETFLDQQSRFTINQSLTYQGLKLWRMVAIA
ncbi:MAG: hypothetical protein KME08_20970 [Aphanothece sp. CMT-3BRIN-NPC111]|nr:hypothetical protein [Aphanothece sp. CMT-3BRIN-NPC111]